MRVSFDDMKAEFYRVFVKYGMSKDKAEICARVHAETSLDGVYSHGSNRILRFIGYVGKGWIDVNAEPELIQEFGALAVYDGHLGPGILNGLFCVDKAVALAAKSGVGLVAIRNTNHWQRGGTYGLYAAERGFMLICWTNTSPNMPCWGGRDVKLGNNPFVIAVPSEDAEAGPLMLDMACSQYSFGKLETCRLQGKKLPVPGGYDKDGNLTSDPALIEESKRVFPTGFWKGSSLSFMLDIIAAVLSQGINTARVRPFEEGDCCGVSQVFIAIDPEKAGGRERGGEIIRSAKAWLKSSLPSEDGAKIQYPGEGILRARADNKANGIPVDDAIWAAIRAL